MSNYVNLGTIISLDNRQYNASMSQVAQITNQTAATIARKFEIAAGTVYLFNKSMSFIEQTIEKLDKINDVSERFGVSAETVQKYEFACKQTGNSIETLESAFKKMSKVVYEAETGNQGAVDSLRAVGLTLDDLKGKSQEQRFEIIAEALSKVSDSGKKAALAQELFGKSGADLIPLIDNYKELAAEAEEYGIASDSAVKAADRFNDSLSKINQSMMSVVTGTGFIEWLADIAIATDKTVNHIRKSYTGEYKKGGVSGGYAEAGYNTAAFASDALSGYANVLPTRPIGTAIGMANDKYAGDSPVRNDLTFEDQKKLEENKSKYEKSGKREKTSLKDIGLNYDDLKGMTSDGKRYNAIVEALSKVEDTAKRATLAQELLGDSSKDIQPLIDNYKALSVQTKEQFEQIRPGAGSYLKGAGLDFDKDLKDKSPVQRYEMIADAISKVESTAKRARLSEKLLGGTTIDTASIDAQIEELKKKKLDMADAAKPAPVADLASIDAQIRKLEELKKISVPAGKSGNELFPSVENYDTASAAARKNISNSVMRTIENAPPDKEKSAKLSPEELKSRKLGSLEEEIQTLNARRQLSALDTERGDLQDEMNAKLREYKKLLQEAADAGDQGAKNQLIGVKRFEEGVKAQDAEREKKEKAQKYYDEYLKSNEKAVEMQELINKGLEQQASVKKAINDMEKNMGRKLSPDEEKKITQSETEKWNMEHVKDLNPEVKDKYTAPERAPDFTDSLRRIGGTIGGIAGNKVNPLDTERNTILKQINNGIEDLNDMEGLVIT